MDNRLIFLYHLMALKPGGRRKLGWPLNGWRFKAVGCFRGKRNLETIAREPMSWPYGLKQPMLRFQEKPRVKWSHVVPVPQTDSGGRGENPQALERTLAKELGKLPP